MVEVEVIKTKLLDYIKSKGFNDFHEIKDETLKKTVTKSILYMITSNFNSEYEYGLLLKLFEPNFNFADEIGWIIKQQTYKIPPTATNNTTCSFNIEYKDQEDRVGHHRSGWQYVYTSIKQYQNIDGPLLDLYVDETFHWAYELYELVGIVPYTKPWYGVVHHTFDTQFSVYNSTLLMENVGFIKSLTYCKGIIVLSKSLQIQFKKHFKKLSISVPVYLIYHPTEFVTDKFTIKKFLENNDKKLLSVGTWYRDLFNFYNLKVSLIKKSLFKKKINLNLRKVLLTGRDKNNYIPNSHFIPSLSNFLIHEQSNNSHTDSHKHCCRHNSHNHKLENNWYISLLNVIDSIIDSVEVLSFRPNNIYDKLLDKNIVYLKLYSASAVNTLIECVVRDTPIIINKLDAVVEILGPDYPLYIEDLIGDDDINLEIAMHKIVEAHKYLQKLDKTKLRIETFISDLTRIISLD